MKSISRLMFKCLLLTVVLLLTGCSRAMFDPKGIVAAHETELFVFATLLMMIVIIPVFIMTFLFAYRYRASNKKAKYSPGWTHSYLLEAVWWAVPFVIIAILGVVTWVSSHRLSPYRPLAAKSKTLVIQVVALNWKWLFIYPKQHIATVNYVQFPVHKPIEFLITSDAPMNSFLIPKLAGQIYAMSGMQTQLHLIASAEGVYRGLSANYSGLGFAGMRFKAHVTSEQQFKSWVQEGKKSQHHLTASVYKALAKDSKDNPVVLYSKVEPDLFRKIIFKYTKPEGHKAFVDNPQGL